MSTQPYEQQPQAQQFASQPTASTGTYSYGDPMKEYYNIAYAAERRRLNETFGRIPYPNEFIDTGDTKEIVKTEVVYKDPDPSEYVPVAEVKKEIAKEVKKVSKKKTGAIVAVSIVAGVAVAALAVLLLHTFGIFTLPFLA